MAFDDTSAGDAAALLARRERLRVLAGRIAEAVEAMAMPESFLEGERAARAVTVADRMLAKLPEPLPEPRSEEDEADNGTVSPVRLRLRVFADQALVAVEALPPPKTFLEGERAGRCVLAAGRLFVQLYAPPKLPKGAPEDFDDALETEQDNSPEAAGLRVFEKIDWLTHGHAQDTGFYPDGGPCDPAAPAEYERLCCPEEKRLMAEWLGNTAAHPFPPKAGVHQVAQIMTARVNASARAKAGSTGTWPDGRAFHEDAPDFYAISRRFDEVCMKGSPAPPGPAETHGPRGFPWWMVCRTNPDSG